MPTIIKPPVPEIEVEINGTFTIYCEAIGVPTPLITWRLNWGNIPTGERITVISEGGRGTLIVRFARPEDAGAYTCEALNNRGSIFATPDALIIVRREYILKFQTSCNQVACCQRTINQGNSYFEIKIRNKLFLVLFPYWRCEELEMIW